MILGRTTRLLRVEPADVDLLLRWQDDPDVMRGWGVAAPLPSRAALERDIAGRRADADLYLIIETADGRPVGRLDVMFVDPRHRSCEVALYVGECVEQGEGLGADALAAACAYLFDQRGLHRVALTVLAGNARALAVYERLGFRREGTLRHSLCRDGELQDEIAMSLLAGELRLP